MQTVIQRLNANINVRSYNVVTIVNGQEVEQQPAVRRIRIAANATQAVLQARVGPNWQDVGGVAPVTQAQLTQFVNIIGRSTLNGNHRNVLQMQEWQNLYNAANRVLTYIGYNGALIAPPNPMTVPCRDCGLVLPERNIHIDHQRPVVGNAYEPVCKVFRAMGLTVGGPGGGKGVSVNAAYAAAVGGTVGAPAGNLNNAYTLNDRGEIFYSLVDWAGRTLFMQERCLNHIINLRPLCGACNTPNRNVRHF